jgi:hypothetical protein
LQTFIINIKKKKIIIKNKNKEYKNDFTSRFRFPIDFPLTTALPVAINVVLELRLILILYLVIETHGEESETVHFLVQLQDLQVNWAAHFPQQFVQVVGSREVARRNRVLRVLRILGILGVLEHGRVLVF